MHWKAAFHFNCGEAQRISFVDRKGRSDDFETKKYASGNTGCAAGCYPTFELETRLTLAPICVQTAREKIPGYIVTFRACGLGKGDLGWDWEQSTFGRVTAIAK